ncbi:MAG: biotin--[acetyl-CoA-carboxylase] ligase [Betaproteobacteria bacterium]|nr:biotin--[acetyl-CoA-carboxylase] ligase [Betaproteobacteria bacterium]
MKSCPSHRRDTEALDATAIREALAERGAAVAVEVLQTCTSTNSVLLERPADAGAHREPLALFAETQTAGRGRRGRRWHAAPGAGLTFSLRWRCAGGAARLAGLSLAVGVGAARALHALGARAVELKWPNDLLAVTGAGEGKLGGVLVETRGSSNGEVLVVVGLGLNLHTAEGLDERLGRRVAALDQLLDPLPPRNLLAAALVAALARTLEDFARDGLRAFVADWQALHAHRGQRLRVRMADGRVLSGTADGIADDGGLLLRNRRGVHAVHSGSVVRARGAAARTPAARAAA